MIGKENSWRGRNESDAKHVVSSDSPRFMFTSEDSHDERHVVFAGQRAVNNGKTNHIGHEIQDKSMTGLSICVIAEVFSYVPTMTKLFNFRSLPDLESNDRFRDPRFAVSFLTRLELGGNGNSEGNDTEEKSISKDQSWRNVLVSGCNTPAHESSAVSPTEPVNG